MLKKIQLIRNIGQFDNVNGGQFDLTKLTLIYAENGRGKTTLAAILKSASTGDVNLVNERRRLTATHDPHIILRDQTGSIAFQNGTWSRLLPQIAVFDDQFVSDNICSGIEIAAEHRQNIHEFILGAQGVSLNAELQRHVAAIEGHNKRLRSLPDAIPAYVRGRFNVDAFCALEARADIDEAIAEAERSLAAAHAADAVRTKPGFEPLNLPAFDVAELNSVLLRGLADLEAEAASRVRAHIKTLGVGGEAWIADGVSLISDDSCPFCAQDLTLSPVIVHYQAYFSENYQELKAAIVSQGKSITATHGRDVPAAFERDFRVAVQTQEFWNAFTSIPAIEIDTVEVARAWKVAREGVIKIFRDKHAAPLDCIEMSEDIVAAIDTYHQIRQEVLDLSAAYQSYNEPIALVRERTEGTNAAVLEADLAELRARKARFAPDITAACQAYVDEKAAKIATERLRDQARAALDQYRTAIFPTYETAINEYLRRLGASFRVTGVQSVNNRGGSSCNYSVLINAVPVSITSVSGLSFRNTLSAGDRNTLALAFFFASLDHDHNIGDKIVVIDDPMTSLDEHRNRNTISEMRKLLNRVSQMIVLSHSKTFLCPLWKDAAPSQRSELRLDRVRDGQNRDSTTITSWNVHDDCVSENDRRHEIVMSYIQNADPSIERSVAESLRPMLEAYLRVGYPDLFQPGAMIGPFINICKQRLGTPNEVLNRNDIVELDDLREYANTFHHDSNTANLTVLINGAELSNFCQRVIQFIRRT
ncbi:AAA family ATPase [Methylobacterium durans]|uniref:Protein CR006 P-loop domain-containing protein n=1 Tax=Methylobacterium durans TaxID=2202825 RepID=A0A2U8WGX4_9HYPH|nr:AAA family ATPase [Methylobacterium durans]AWN44566.1 hypothetical protein DK389_14835 [Methylobacterium durans]